MRKAGKNKNQKNNKENANNSLPDDQISDSMKAIHLKDGKVLYQQDIEEPQVEPLEDVIINEDPEEEEEIFENDAGNELIVITESDLEDSTLLPQKRACITDLHCEEEDISSIMQTSIPSSIENDFAPIRPNPHEAAHSRNNQKQKVNSQSAKASPKKIIKTNATTCHQTPQPKRQNNITPVSVSPIKTQSFDFGLITGIILITIAVIMALFLTTAKSKLTSNEKIRDEIIFKLNDCIDANRINAINIDSINGNFSQWLKENPSEYIKSENGSYVINRPYTSTICKIINFGDRHPTLAGLYIAWGLFFICYIIRIINRYKAMKMIPEVIGIIKNHDGCTCYVDDVKKTLQSRGHNVFWTWGHVTSIISQYATISTIKTDGSKPIWIMT